MSLKVYRGSKRVRGSSKPKVDQTKASKPWRDCYTSDALQLLRSEVVDSINSLGHNVGYLLEYCHGDRQAAGETGNALIQLCVEFCEKHVNPSLVEDGEVPIHIRQ